MYVDGTELSIPEVAKDRPQYDFLQAVSSIDREFYTYWKGECSKREMEGTTQYTLYELMERFRKSRGEAMAERNMASHGAFPATLHGQPAQELPAEGTNTIGTSSSAPRPPGRGGSPAPSRGGYTSGRPGEPGRERKPCLCGGSHSWRSCYYLVEGRKAYGGFVPDPKTQRMVEGPTQGERGPPYRG